MLERPCIFNFRPRCDAGIAGPDTIFAAVAYADCSGPEAHKLLTHTLDGVLSGTHRAGALATMPTRFVWQNATCSHRVLQAAHPPSLSASARIAAIPPNAD